MVIVVALIPGCFIWRLVAARRNFLVVNGDLIKESDTNEFQMQWGILRCESCVDLVDLVVLVTNCTLT